MDSEYIKVNKCNAGFTLLELVISVAIMFIIVLVGGQFMVTSANSYSSLQRSVSLSQASKQVSEQMSENSIDSSAAVIGGTQSGSEVTFGESEVIYFLEYKGSTGSGTTLENLFDIHAYKYDAATKSLKYDEAENVTLKTARAAAGNLKFNETLCENFDDGGFRASAEIESKESRIQDSSPVINYADSFTMTLGLKKRDKTFRSENVTAFRGRTVWVPDFDKLESKEYAEEVNDR